MKRRKLYLLGALLPMIVCVAWIIADPTCSSDEPAAVPGIMRQADGRPDIAELERESLYREIDRLTVCGMQH